MKIRFALTALSVALVAAAGSASAATATGSFKVSVDVKSSCLVSTADIHFPNYEPALTGADGHYDSSGVVSVRCTAGSSNVKVQLDQGANADPASSCAIPARRLKSAAGGFVSYGIYSSMWLDQVWGCDASNQQNIDSFTSSLVPVDLVSYVSIRGGQDVAIGTYSDTVGVTVTF